MQTTDFASVEAESEERSGEPAPSAAVNPFPEYTQKEVFADLCIHIAGLTFAVIGIPWLLIKGFRMEEASFYISLPLYAAGLAAMLGFSAAYNLVNHPPAKEILRRFDHSAIFLMIAGSYGPFALSKIGGPWGIGLFAFVWALALIGTSLAFLVPRKADKLTIVLCLLMGWSIVVAIEPLMRAVSLGVVILLGVGGIIYSAGVAFHMAERLPYHNAIWHACVLAAAGCHYAAVMMAVG
ncbi:MAG: PAQR family membrane homeostasis protein TrhA [Alphaproteobacteria bacterium]